MPVITVRPTFPSLPIRRQGFLPAGFIVAVLMTLCLIWAMYRLISVGHDMVEPPPPTTVLEFVRLNREERAPERRRQKPNRPPVVDQPLPNMAQSWSTPDDGAAINWQSHMQSGHAVIDLPGPAGITHRAAMPLTEISPIYPEKALARGIEGTCEVIYTITKTGSVSNLRVNEDQCASSLFHRAALRAASKFKYAPRIVDGETVVTTNVAKRFRFSIRE
ncbi:MAG: energy transducer TonB [Pseudomonadota bacterium]